MDNLTNKSIDKLVESQQLPVQSIYNNQNVYDSNRKKIESHIRNKSN